MGVLPHNQHHHFFPRNRQIGFCQSHAFHVRVHSSSPSWHPVGDHILFKEPTNSFGWHVLSMLPVHYPSGQCVIIHFIKRLVKRPVKKFANILEKKRGVVGSKTRFKTRFWDGEWRKWRYEIVRYQRLAEMRHENGRAVAWVWGGVDWKTWGLLNFSDKIRKAMGSAERHFFVTLDLAWMLLGYGFGMIVAYGGLARMLLGSELARILLKFFIFVVDLNWHEFWLLLNFWLAMPWWRYSPWNNWMIVALFTYKPAILRSIERRIFFSTTL